MRIADARILSFEPLAGPAARWRAVFAGDAGATLVEAAVGPRAGKARIHVSARDDSSSLLPIAARQNALFPGTAEEPNRGGGAAPTGLLSRAGILTPASHQHIMM